MKRSIVLLVLDSAEVPVAVRSHNGFNFPEREISALAEPRAEAQKLGIEIFGADFSIGERLGSFESSADKNSTKNSALIIFAGRSLRFDSRHVTVTDNKLSSQQIDLVLSLTATTGLKRAA